MTHNRVPAKETTYQCQYFELPNDRDYHLIASEPYIDNANVMHHIAVMGCPQDVSKWLNISFHTEVSYKTKLVVPRNSQREISVKRSITRL